MLVVRERLAEAQPTIAEKARYRRSRPHRHLPPDSRPMLCRGRSMWARSATLGRQPVPQIIHGRSVGASGRCVAALVENQRRRQDRPPGSNQAKKDQLRFIVPLVRLIPDSRPPVHRHDHARGSARMTRLSLFRGFNRSINHCSIMICECPPVAVNDFRSGARRWKLLHLLQFQPSESLSLFHRCVRDSISGPASQ